MLTDGDANAKVQELKVVADEIGCTTAQLALAWTASNPNVSSVILGASRVEQLNENLQALEVLEGLTEEHKARIDEIFA
jgi:aryl-alcohol dehydrogenase-like predicted oxidoreductase